MARRQPRSLFTRLLVTAALLPAATLAVSARHARSDAVASSNHHQQSHRQAAAAAHRRAVEALALDEDHPEQGAVPIYGAPGVYDDLLASFVGTEDDEDGLSAESSRLRRWNFDDQDKEFDKREEDEVAEEATNSTEVARVAAVEDNSEVQVAAAEVPEGSATVAAVSSTESATDAATSAGADTSSSAPLEPSSTPGDASASTSDAPATSSSVPTSSSSSSVTAPSGSGSSSTRSGSSTITSRTSSTPTSSSSSRTTTSSGSTPSRTSTTSSTSSSKTTTTKTTTTTTGTVFGVLATTTRRTTTKTTTTRTGCAATYKVPQMITGTGTLPKPSTYVTRYGSELGLKLDGKSWRMVGTNIYWLCNDENRLDVPKGYYTEKTRIREGLAIAVALGANTIRVISCGTSVGYKYAIEPKVGSFSNAEAWDRFDYVIYAAGQYGLRVVLPLTDNYQYYHGGKYDFLRWKGISTANNGRQFYTNSQAIASYKAYIKTVMTRTNQFNKKKYCNDPTIVAWETGNELGAWMGQEGYPPLAWTNNIAKYIKGLAPRQLVIDGSDGFRSGLTGATAPGLNSPYIDMMSDHGYPRSISQINSEIPLVTKAKKGFLIGEFDWTNAHGGDSLQSYLAKIESHYYLSALIWSVQGHDNQCCKFLAHNDGYSMYYPNGNTDENQNLSLLVAQSFYRMTNRKVPSQLPGVTCPQPEF